MNSQFVTSAERRIRGAEAFAQQFNRFEWEYLCSYSWFTKSLAWTAQTGDFSSLQVKAEKALTDAYIRAPRSKSQDETALCHSIGWWD
jgi:hypothetical protein